MKIEVSTTMYEFTHGQKPRGAWTSGWMFEFTTETGAVAHQSFNGTYTEAKKQAVRFAKTDKRIVKVSVAP